MKKDGKDVRRLTHLGVMSWAPFYHPSGEYIIFTTNLYGNANFELYIVDSLGEHAPVRVTAVNGFDGLPVFSPSGEELVWTSNRTAVRLLVQTSSSPLGEKTGRPSNPLTAVTRTGACSPRLSTM